MSTLHIDFETRSAVDLTKTGVYVYALDSTTDVWCAAFAFDDGPVQSWTPEQPCPPDIIDHVVSGGEIAAWNANFERVIWRTILTRRYGWPEPALEQYRCVMVEALAMALPGKLENAAPAVGISEQKDAAGQRVMRQMMKPRKVAACPQCGGNGQDWEGRLDTCAECGGTGQHLTWWDQPEKRERLVAYCAQDVQTERAIEKRLVRLRPIERKLWFLDQVANDRGVTVDTTLCNQAKTIVAETTAKLDAEMNEITGGEVFKCSNVQALAVWLKKQGVDTDSVAKDVITDLLIRDDLTPAARRALELRQEAAKASTSKIATLLRGMNADGRARGLLQFSAASTGRWAGRRFQPQNLPRPDVEKEEVLRQVEAVLTGDPALVAMLYGPPLTVVANCVRPMLVAPKGKDLLAVDFVNIEGRVVAWLAGEEWKLDAFRAFDAGTGPDLYLVSASGIYNVPIAEAKPFRQVGKVSELALGFQGGPGAFAKMAKNYNLKVETAYGPVWESAPSTNRELALDAWDQRGRRTGMKREAWLAAELIKIAWRGRHPRIEALWKGLEAAAIDAVANPGKLTSYGRIKYRKAGSFLWCQLPSGRALCYPYATLIEKKTPWGKVVPAVRYKGVDTYTRKWGEKDFYGGLGTENVVQAAARDLLGEGMLRVEEAGYWVVLTVHDEDVSEVDQGFGSLEEFEDLMAVVPVWAKGLPVAAEGWRGARYRK